MPTWRRGLLSQHWPLAVVLAVAALARVASAVAYAPALFYFDSFSYLNVALSRPVLGMAPDRPSGYPALLRILSLDGTTLAPVTVAQHVAGLLVGGIVYALLYRLGVRRWIATAVAAVVLLEAYAVALEQHIMAESFATLALAASTYFLVVGSSRPRLLALSGLLLAAAIGMRTAATFAVLPWFVYVVWTNRGLRPVLAAGCALLIPLLAYSSLHAAVGKGFSMGQADGWFLYARTAPFADCDGVAVPNGTRQLCRTRRPSDVSWYLWDPDSPALRMFGGVGAGGDREASRSNRLLRDFAVAQIRARPGAYVKSVASDLTDYFTTQRDSSNAAIVFPRGAPPVYGGAFLDQYFSGVRPENRFPAAVVRTYHDIARVRGFLLLPFILLALLSLAIAAVRRPSADLRPKETFLLLGIGACTLIGSTATSAYILRYLVPTVPFFVAAGGLAASGLLGRLDVRFARRTTESRPVSSPTAV